MHSFQNKEEVKDLLEELWSFSALWSLLPCITLKLISKSSEISSFLAEPIGQLAFICMFDRKFIIEEDPILGALTLYWRRDAVELEILGLELHLAWTDQIAKDLIPENEPRLCFAFAKTTLVLPFTPPFSLEPTWGFMGHAALYFWWGLVLRSESKRLMVRLRNLLSYDSGGNISLLDIFT